MADRTFLDWPFLDATHRELHDRVEAWAGDTLPGLDLSEAEDIKAVAEDVRRLVASLGKHGLLKAATGGGPDTDYGTLDARSICITREVLARHSGLADFAFAMQGLGTGAINLFGTDAQRARYLPAVARGELISAFALSESEAGSDVASLTTSAQPGRGGWLLNGSKAWISNAGIAGVHVVFARTGEAPGGKGISAFIVESDRPGFRVGELLDITSPHPIGTLVFENCLVPDDNRIGEPGRGFAIAMSVLDVFRSSVGAAALGFSRAALDASVAHATTRKLFGEPLSALQMTQAKIADMALDIDAAALLIYRAAWTKDVEARRVSREASMAKLFATEAAQRAVDCAVQLHGGHGVVKGSLPERLYRDVRPLRIYEGASEVQKVIIAGQVLREAGDN